MREGAFYSYIKPKANQNELISVIIRTYGDRNNFLKEAIASVYNQTYSNIEIVVIEDGTNNAEEYIQSLIGKNIKNIIYKSIPKGGRCKAGNMGLSLANGEYLIFLDDDDLFYPEHLEVLSNELSSNSNVSAVYSNAFEVATKIISKDPLEYLELGYDIIYKQAFSRPLIWCHNYIPIQTILFKRELYDKYGGFDEELENFEDWNLWTRYSLKHDFKYIPKTTSMYRVPANKDNLKSRQREFDCYYIKALEKQKELKITTSPDEIIHYCTEINKNMYLFQVSVENVKRILKRYSIFNNFYYYARKLYYNYK
jgi:glycosyltransferase involved in cell wall biosynthesis